MSGSQIVCRNRKAHYDYEVLETVEAGIVLTGTEIKSIRQNHVSLDGSFASLLDGNVELFNCNIDPYEYGSTFNHPPKRRRRLLLHKSEIAKFAVRAEQRGFSLIPISMYLLNGRAKVELAICKGKQKQDKRQAIKERDDKREMNNVT